MLCIIYRFLPVEKAKWPVCQGSRSDSFFGVSKTTYSGSSQDEYRVYYEKFRTATILGLHSNEDTFIIIVRAPVDTRLQLKRLPC